MNNHSNLAERALDVCLALASAAGATDPEDGWTYSIEAHGGTPEPSSVDVSYAMAGAMDVRDELVQLGCERVVGSPDRSLDHNVESALDESMLWLTLTELSVDLHDARASGLDQAERLRMIGECCLRARRELMALDSREAVASREILGAIAGLAAA